MEINARDDYRETGTYKRADAALRRQYENWKSEQDISDVQMALFLRLQDLRDTPKDEKRKGNKTAETMLVFSMFFFLIAVSVRQNAMLLVASLIVIVNTVIYLSGITNPYSSAMRRLKKCLKAYPTVKSFEQWQKEQNSVD